MQGVFEKKFCETEYFFCNLPESGKPRRISHPQIHSLQVLEARKRDPIPKSSVISNAEPTLKYA